MKEYYLQELTPSGWVLIAKANSSLGIARVREYYRSRFPGATIRVSKSQPWARRTPCQVKGTEHTDPPLRVKIGEKVV